MSDAGAYGTSHVVDLADTFAEPGERDHLIRCGAEFLTCSDEDVVIRSGSLALEYFELVRRQNKRAHRWCSVWQCRLTALALLTAACRERARQMAEANGQTRH